LAENVTEKSSDASFCVEPDGAADTFAVTLPAITATVTRQTPPARIPRFDTDPPDHAFVDISVSTLG
jgi:hypothetical protein